MTARLLAVAVFGLVLSVSDLARADRIGVFYTDYCSKVPAASGVTCKMFRGKAGGAFMVLTIVPVIKKNGNPGHAIKMVTDRLMYRYIDAGGSLMVINATLGGQPKWIDCPRLLYRNSFLCNDWHPGKFISPGVVKK